MGENVVWSPNSRLAIEEQDSKWSTDFLRLYAIGADDKVLVLDLQKIIEPAVRKRLRQLGKNAWQSSRFRSKTAPRSTTGGSCGYQS